MSGQTLPSVIRSWLIVFIPGEDPAQLKLTTMNSADSTPATAPMDRQFRDISCRLIASLLWCPKTAWFMQTSGPLQYCGGRP
jgi:hypothetical protein